MTAVSKSNNKAAILCVPLRYWFGPFAVATVKLNLVVENCRVVPGMTAAPDPPSLSDLPGNAQGLFRRSEPAPCGTSPLNGQGPFMRYVETSYERRFIDLTGDFENYLQNFSSKTRNTLRRKVKKFAALSGGEIDVRCYATPREMERFYSLARDISKVTYQERLFAAGLPETETFLMEMRRDAKGDRVRAFILFMNGEPISYLYCPVVEDRLIYRYLGYRPDYAPNSPGTVLQYLALEQIFTEGRFDTFDFTEGQGEHKRLFSTHAVPCQDVIYLPRSIGNRLLLMSHRMFRTAANGIVELTDRIQLKPVLRRWVRRA